MAGEVPLSNSLFHRIVRRIGCILGKHWYQPSEITVHGERDWGRGVYTFTAYHRCHYCGKRMVVHFELPEPLDE